MRGLVPAAWMAAGVVLFLAAAPLRAAELTPNQIYPQPLVPPDNPSSAAKIALGKRLFSETRLSITGAYACATCHQPDRHFTDGRRQAVGATGEVHAFNTPTLYNAGLNSSLGWSSQHLTTLEDQHRIPLLNTNPLEMGFHQDHIKLLLADTSYAAQFAQVFADAPITIRQLTQALAAYVRTLQPPISRFDEYLFLDRKNALSAQEHTGMALFFSERLGCATCHANLTFSGPISHAAERAEPVFHVTGVGADRQAFRAPTLRQIKHTAPYMHNGSLPTLHSVVRHYEDVDVERVPEFTLTDEQRGALVAFLGTL